MGGLDDYYSLVPIEILDFRIEEIEITEPIIEEFEIEKGILKKYNGSATQVEIPVCVTKIGCFAFSECISLKSLYLSEKVSSLGGTWSAFDKCDNLVITTTAGSYAEEYAKKMKLRVRLI